VSRLQGRSWQPQDDALGVTQHRARKHAAPLLDPQQFQVLLGRESEAGSTLPLRFRLDLNLEPLGGFCFDQLLLLGNLLLRDHLLLYRQDELGIEDRILQQDALHFDATHI